MENRPTARVTSDTAEPTSYAQAAAQEPAWRSPGEAAIAILDGRGESRCADFAARVRRQEMTIAKVDERCASRPSDFTTRVARSKTAIELMNESGKSQCADFTRRVERRFPKVTATPGEHKTPVAKLDGTSMKKLASTCQKQCKTQVAHFSGRNFV